MDARSYSQLLRYARIVSKRADEAEDLVQTALLAAVEAGRTDLTADDTQRWLRGVLRKRALHEACTARRRVSRERQSDPFRPTSPEPVPETFLAGLPVRLRVTARLVLSGHSKTEIAWLLRLNDAALRQRIAEIRRRWRRYGDGQGVPAVSLRGDIAFGRIRAALVPRAKEAILASHDSDGHLFMISSQNRRPRQL